VTLGTDIRDFRNRSLQQFRLFIYFSAAYGNIEDP